MSKHGHKVTKRAVRDKYKAVKDVIVKRNAKKLKESGIAHELTEVETEITYIIEDLTEVEKETKERQSVKDCDVKDCEKGPWRHSQRQIKLWHFGSGYSYPNCNKFKYIFGTTVLKVIILCQ